tara:strand:- start:761 stop:1795 length:1035 start_codon:yes stop_codon:yes gene_type:complete
MDKNFYLFMIPDSKNHGAQNFFRRLHKNFDSKNKMLLIEDERSFKDNFSLLKNFSRNNKLKLITTVNSNKLGLLYKIYNPKVDLIARLGNTVSQEIKKKTVKFVFHKIFYFLLIFFSKKIIFQSQLMKNDFVNFFNFKNYDEKFQVINNGVSIPDQTSINHKTSSRLIEKSKLNFLLVGSFKHQKGYDIFFDSLNYLEDSLFEKIHFHICGAGEKFHYFESILINSKFKKIVTLHGEVKPENFYNECNIYILPSRFEGFSNSLIEALSYGLPAIVADCPSANREVISDSFNGVFFLNENSKDLAKKIKYMVKNHAQFKQELIIEDVVKRFSINVVASFYKKLFI